MSRLVASELTGSATTPCHFRPELLTKLDIRTILWHVLVYKTLSTYHRHVHTHASIHFMICRSCTPQHA